MARTALLTIDLRVTGAIPPAPQGDQRPVDAESIVALEQDWPAKQHNVEHDQSREPQDARGPCLQLKYGQGSEKEEG